MVCCYLFLVGDEPLLIKLSVTIEDAAEREAFRLDQGEFLPSDIWPGLSSPPPRYEVVPIDKDASGTPELPKKLIEQALRRAGDLSGKI
jgi:hypothetical protein